GEEAAAAIDDEDNPFAPGLVATFRGADNVERVRLVDDLSYVWNEASPDRSLPAGPFTATFAGRLWVQAPGRYKLHVFTVGHVRLSVAGKVVLEGHAAEPAWIVGEPLELPFGFHPLEV